LIPHQQPAAPPPAAEPTSDKTASGTRRRPRNYLSRTEHRRLFWTFMPPALVLFLTLGWIERTYLRPPSAPPPQVDTTLKSAAVERTVGDAVVIEAEPEPFVATAEEVGASVHALQRVRDDTVFREDDDDAWFQIWLTLRSGDMPAMKKSAAQPVTFIELFGQPRSFRGRLVRFGGTVHRLQKVAAPANNYDITGYWQAWIEPDGGPASPIVVYFLRLPEGMPHGLDLNESVEVIGYFFKRWAYQASDTIRTAPLVMAIEPVWKPHVAPQPGGTMAGGYALVAMAGLVLLTLLGMRLASSSTPLRASPGPADLSATLAGAEVISPAEALNRMAAAHRAAEQNHPETSKDSPP
jgi:hypothetical protein